MQLYISRHHY